MVISGKIEVLMTMVVVAIMVMVMINLLAKKQKWVNTYNTRAAKYLAFWKWLTQPELKKEERQIPPQLKGLKFAKRKTKTSVRREDLWTDEEHKVFLERCEDPRLACFHAIALETGGRPSELLALKISD